MNPSMNTRPITLSLLAFSAFVAALAPVSASADQSTDINHYLDENSPSTGYFGALLGANIPSGNNGSDQSANLGLTLGAKVTPYVGLGFYGTYYSQSNSGSVFNIPTGTSSSTFNLAGEINFFYLAFHAGADLGATITSWSGSTGSLAFNTSQTHMIVGPEIGADFPLGLKSLRLSVGGEVHYLITTASNAQNNLQILSVFKVWL